jgi:hypothetical protein
MQKHKDVLSAVPNYERQEIESLLDYQKIGEAELTTGKEIEIYTSKEIHHSDFEQIEKKYKETLNVAPAPDAENWILIKNKHNQTLLASSALAKMRLNTIPFVFSGQLKNENHCNKILNSINADMDTSSEIGTFIVSAENNNELIEISALFFYAIALFLKEKKQHNNGIMVIHEGIRKIFEALKIKFNKFSKLDNPLPEKEIKRQMQKNLKMNLEQIVLCWDNYITNKRCNIQMGGVNIENSINTLKKMPIIQRSNIEII